MNNSVEYYRKLISIINHSNESMCLLTAKKMIEYYNHIEMDVDIFDAMDILSRPGIYSVELRFETADKFNNTKKQELIEKYNIPDYYQRNFTFKFPDLRLFYHKFNIYNDGNQAIISGSWLYRYMYKILFELTYQEYCEYLSRFYEFCDDFNNKSGDLSLWKIKSAGEFNREFPPDVIKNIDGMDNMIKNENFKLKTSIIINANFF